MDLKIVSGQDIVIPGNIYSIGSQLIRQVLIDTYENKIVNPAKITSKNKRGDVTINMLAARLDPYTSASKIFLEYASSDVYQGSHSMILIVDGKTPDVCTLMDCGHLTAIRTGIISGLLAKEISTEDPKSLAVVGSGLVAQASIQSILTEFPKIEHVVIFSHRVGVEVMTILEKLATRFPRVKFEGCSSLNDLEKHVGLADIVAGCSGGRRPDPILSAWLKPGASVLAIGHGISADVYRQNFPLVTTNIAQMGMFDDASSKSGSSFNVRGELAECIVGARQGRASIHPS